MHVCWESGVIMKLGLKNRYALITGGSRGIGMAIARSLAGEGVRVCVVSRGISDLEKLLDSMGGQSAGHLSVPLDLTLDDSPEKLFNIMREANFGSLDVLVHSLGGTDDIRDPFCTVADWRRLYRLNFEVIVELNNIFLPAMLERKWGRIVHISSIAAMENQGPVPYCAFKAALTAYTRSMGGVLAPDGVVMSAILPGAVFTEGGYWDGALKNRPEHVHKFLKERQRIGRFGSVDEIASWVTFLCSEHASFNVGSIIPVDGGQGRGYFGQ